MSFWWCRRHERVEEDGSQCGARHVLGPYGSRADAQDHAAIAEARTDAWDEADRRWQQWGDDDDQR